MYLLGRINGANYLRPCWANWRINKEQLSGPIIAQTAADMGILKDLLNAKQPRPRRRVIMEVRAEGKTPTATLADMGALEHATCIWLLQRVGEQRALFQCFRLRTRRKKNRAEITDKKDVQHETVAQKRFQAEDQN